MRIAHVTDCYLPRLGGIEMQVRDLATRQQQAGEDVEIITATPAIPGPGLDFSEPVRVLRMASGVAPVARSIVAALDVPDMLRSGGYDQVHVHASVMSPLATGAALAACRLGLPTAITVHSMWSRLGPLPPLVVGSLGMREAPVAWSAVSETAAQAVRRALARHSWVMVLPNGIEAREWRVEPCSRRPDEVLIASVMRLAPRKRPLQLLRMLRCVQRLVEPQVRVRAVIVGEGPMRGVLDRYLVRHNMRSSVDLTGQLDRERIRDVFSRADIYVAPAELESFGIAALEARAAGLPVVATRRGGVGEFITHGRDGLLGWDDHDLVHAMTTLATLPALRLKIADHNRLKPPLLSWEYTLGRSALLYETAGRLAPRGRLPVRTAGHRVGRTIKTAAR
jgi:glycosyltransferase involved in cell wall biosynthesis